MYGSDGEPYVQPFILPDGRTYLVYSWYISVPRRDDILAVSEVELFRAELEYTHLQFWVVFNKSLLDEDDSIKYRHMQVKVARLKIQRWLEGECYEQGYSNWNYGVTLHCGPVPEEYFIS